MYPYQTSYPGHDQRFLGFFGLPLAGAFLGGLIGGGLGGALATRPLFYGYPPMGYPPMGYSPYGYPGIPPYYY